MFYDKYIMILYEFGYSGKSEDVLFNLKLGDEMVTKRIEKLLK